MIRASRAAGLYGDDSGDYPDNGARFTLLGRAALEAMRAEARPADVLHGHDWQAGPAILSLRSRYAHDPLLARIATVMTCHNLAYHGWVPRERAWSLDLPAGRSATSRAWTCCARRRWPRTW